MHEAAWSRSDAIARLESADRRANQDPQTLWSQATLRPGEVVVDIGAGTGFFAFPAARRVGAAGCVYAVDVSSELLDLIRERTEAGKVGNLRAVRSTPAHIPLPDGVADVVLLANVLHGVPPATVAEAVRLLRPGGRLVNVDWKKEASREGPPVRHRLSEGEAQRGLRRYGLVPVRRFELGPHHYGLVLERPPPDRRPRHLLSAE